MKLAKYLVCAVAMVAVAFTATADHSSNPYEIARQAGYVKSDTESLLIGLTRGRSPDFQLINKTGMVAKEAQDLERAAEGRGGRNQSGDIQREAREVFAAFRSLARDFRADRGNQNHRGAFQQLAQSIEDLRNYVGGQGGDRDDGGDGYDGRDDGQDGGYDGHDGQDDGYDGQDGGHDGHDGQDGGYDGHDGQDGGYDGHDGQDGGDVDGFDGGRN